MSSKFLALLNRFETSPESDGDKDRDDAGNHVPSTTHGKRAVFLQLDDVNTISPHATEVKVQGVKLNTTPTPADDNSNRQAFPSFKDRKRLFEACDEQESQEEESKHHEQSV